jgi:hypothetical protein
MRLLFPGSLSLYLEVRPEVTFEVIFHGKWNLLPLAFNKANAEQNWND